ncbi:hypothetical protein B0H10DRAFT_2212812 [Mycena sp. CBHHK59/15]|nr:hypothetical protein B0H10DRAFT_2212812 [Mycena sp. CBHHK59/15]
MPDVHSPRAVVQQNPASHGPIAHIAQTFIESVGVPTVNQWVRNARAHGWSLTQSNTARAPLPNPASMTLISAPDAADSAHYKFFGRPVGDLDGIIGTAASSPVVIPDDDVEELLERLAESENRSNERLTCIHALEEQTEMLISQVEALERALVAERNPVSVPTRSTPATPSRSRPAPATATPSRSQPAPAHTPATPTRHHPVVPPPYSPPATPQRLMSAYIPSPSRFRDNAALGTFLSSHGIDNHADAINMLVSVVHAVKWADGLVALGIVPELVPRLLEFMEFMSMQ